MALREPFQGLLEGDPIDPRRIDQDFLQFGECADERVELLGGTSPFVRPDRVQLARLVQEEMFRGGRRSDRMISLRASNLEAGPPAERRVPASGG